MKRFWKTAGHAALEGGFALILDDRLYRTPAQNLYFCSTEALAEVVAGEWRHAPENFDPRHMPLTQFVATARDITAARRADIVADAASYAASDMLCFRAAHPAVLAKQQQEIWQPYLDWALDRYDAMLCCSDGPQPPQQEPQALAALRQAVAMLDNDRLTALHQACHVTGSLVLALALVTGWRDAEAIHQAAEMEAHFYLAQWGEDMEARRRLDGILQELKDLQSFARLCSSS